MWKSKYGNKQQIMNLTSRLFTKTLFCKSKSTPFVAFSIIRTHFPPSSSLLQVRAMATDSAASSPFKKVQIQRDNTVTLLLVPVLFSIA